MRRRKIACEMLFYFNKSFPFMMHHASASDGTWLRYVIRYAKDKLLAAANNTAGALLRVFTRIAESRLYEPRERPGHYFSIRSYSRFARPFRAIAPRRTNRHTFQKRISAESSY